MNRISGIFVVSAASVLSFAAVANAAPWASGGPLGPQIDRAVEALKSRNFVVENVAELVAGDPVSGYSAKGDHASDIKKLQAAIRENKTLVKELKAQDVEMNNIVAVERTANGSYIFYVA